jgi:hypothetical protein
MFFQVLIGFSLTVKSAKDLLNGQKCERYSSRDAFLGA